MAENLTSEFCNFLMKQALEQANKAYEIGEVPVGAVVSYQGQIIATAHNEVEQKQDATLHAEVLAIRRASEKISSWRLNECTLCVTLEPCTMCIGAIKLARFANLIFAASDPVKGACGSLFDLSSDARLGPNSKVISGLMAEESANLLKNFFTSKRK